MILVTDLRFWGRQEGCEQRIVQPGFIAASARLIRTLSWYLLIIILFVTNYAPAISQPKVYHVGALMLGRLDRPQLKGLRDGLREAGYIEGKNLLLEVAAGQSYDELRGIANNFVSRKKDVIVTTGSIDTKIAQDATSQIPILFLPASGPRQLGFVESVARPGTNLTGITYYRTLQETGKQLEIFKEVVPFLRRAVLLVDALEDNIGPVSLPLVRKVAAQLAITIAEEPVKSLAQAERALSHVSRNTADGVFVICTALFNDFRRIGKVLGQKKVPLYGCATRQATEEGALLSYAPDLYQIGRRGAWYVDRIFQGAKPQELPVEAPRKFELVINLKTANTIGIKIPPEVLQRADKVIR
jgi:putative tryptophan/tyrosine transport system substrate-binding protein